jgi:hypothetical protein
MTVLDEALLPRPQGAGNWRDRRTPNGSADTVRPGIHRARLTKRAPKWAEHRTLRANGVGALLGTARGGHGTPNRQAPYTLLRRAKRKHVGDSPHSPGRPSFEFTRARRPAQPAVARRCGTRLAADTSVWTDGLIVGATLQRRNQLWRYARNTEGTARPLWNNDDRERRVPGQPRD